MGAALSCVPVHVASGSPPARQVVGPTSRGPPAVAFDSACQTEPDTSARHSRICRTRQPLPTSPHRGCSWSALGKWKLKAHKLRCGVVGAEANCPSIHRLAVQNKRPWKSKMSGICALRLCLLSPALLPTEVGDDRECRMQPQSAESSIERALFGKETRWGAKMELRIGTSFVEWAPSSSPWLQLVINQW